MKPTVVDLQQKFSLFAEHWQPKIVGELNGQYIKLAKLQGEFVWHKHQDEDELFVVVKGEMTIRFREKNIDLKEGQCMIIPRGIEHQPVAQQECHVMLFAPKSILNTGDQHNELTAYALEHI